MSRTELVYLDRDDEYMYFEVFHDKIPQGTIYINRILPLYRGESANKGDKMDFSKLIVSSKI